MLYLDNLPLKTNNLTCHILGEWIGDAYLGNTSKKFTPPFQVIWAEKVF